MTVDVVTTIKRNDDGRLRVTRIRAVLDPQIPPDLQSRAQGCAEVLEDFCTVTESVKQGIDVRVSLKTPEVF
jgi:organic hydroperoxide reductase OsmC/OhrA